MEQILKPWGHEEIWAKTDKYVGKILYIFKGKRLSKQKHLVKDETIYVLHGPMILDLESESIVLQSGESYHIAPNTIHRFCAPEENNVTIVEVSTTELDDVVRLEDDFGRENLDYKSSK